MNKETIEIVVDFMGYKYKVTKHEMIMLGLSLIHI